MQLHFSRWWSLVFGILAELSSGEMYVFSLYSPDFKEHLNFTQDQIQSVGTALNFGAYFGIPAGFVFDRYGPRITGLVGALLAFCGYFLLWCAGTDKFPSNLILVCFFAVLAGNSNGWVDTMAIVSSSTNFPRHRGVVIGILKSFLGLSASINTQIYTSFFAPRSVEFLLFISLFLLAINLLATVFSNRVKPGTPDNFAGSTRRRLGYMGIVIVVTAMMLLVTAVLESKIAFSLTTIRICTGVIFATFALLWLTPLLFRQPSGTVEVEYERLVNSDPSDEAENTDMTYLQAVIDKRFWLLFFSMICGCGAGLMVINNVGQIVQSLGGVHDAQDVYISILSIASCLGRLIAGMMPQYYERRIDRPWFYLASLVIMSAAHLYLAFSNLDMLFAGCVAAGLSFGAFWSLMPAIAADLFGIRNMGAIYNSLGLAPTIGSLLLSQQLSSRIYQSHAAPGTTVCTGALCYRDTFFICSGLNAAASIAVIFLCLLSRESYRRMRQSKIERVA